MADTDQVGPFECGYCGNTVKFTIAVQDLSQVKTFENEVETPIGMMDFSLESGWVYRLLLCPACNKITFERVFTEDGIPEYNEFIYPEPVFLPEGLPDRVAGEYNAALKERRRNPNGYAALLGRVMDAICTDRGIPSRANGRPIFLGVRLTSLAAQENLSSVAGATGLRTVAAHADVGNLLPEDVPYLEALIRYVLDHLYVIPEVNQKAIAAEQARRASVPTTP
jgi:hypothetical protein